MRDDDPVRFVVVEDRMDLSDQVEPVLVDQRLAGQAAKRYLLHRGDSFELREPAQKFPIAQSLIRLDVPSKIQTIDANRVDRSTREDQSHSRQDIHRNEILRITPIFARLRYGPALARASLTASRTPGCPARGQRLPLR